MWCLSIHAVQPVKASAGMHPQRKKTTLCCEIRANHTVKENNDVISIKMTFKCLFSRSNTALCVSMPMFQLPKAKRLKVSLSIVCHEWGHWVTGCWPALSPSDVSGVTGLRVRLTELGDVPRLPGRALSRFYALKEMRVVGSCMCHGHASRCLPEAHSSPQASSIQVCGGFEEGAYGVAGRQMFFLQLIPAFGLFHKKWNVDFNWMYCVRFHISVLG